MNFKQILRIFNDLSVFNKLYFALFLLFSFFIPISNEIARYILVAIVVVFIFHFLMGKRESTNTASNKKWFILSISSLYVLYIFGMIYSQNTEYGLFDLETKLSILIFPILFFFIDKALFQKDVIREIKSAFVIGALFSTLLLFIQAVGRYTQSHEIREFYYATLSYKIHPSYIALYLVFSVSILLNEVLSSHSSSFKKNSFRIVLLIWFSFILVLLSSKAGFISIWALFVLYFLFFGIVKKSWKMPSIYLVVLSVLLIVFLKMFPNMSNRIHIASNSVLTEQEGGNQQLNTQHEGSQVRMEVWKISIGLIQNKPIFGYGTGDVKDVLADACIQNNFEYAAKSKMNCHNQFLQTSISIGIVGLLALLYFFLFPLWIAFKEKSIVLFSFISIVAVNCLFESMLERQFGLMFIAFFFTYLTASLFYSSKNSI